MDRQAIAKYVGVEGLEKYSRLINELSTSRYTIPKDVIDNTRWGFTDAWVNENFVTFLDMLCMSAKAVAEMEYTDEEEAANEYPKLVWTFISNMGLDYYDDENYDKDAVRMTLINCNLREYDPNGRGSMFQFRTSGVDCRNWQLQRLQHSFAIEFYNPTLEDDSNWADVIRSEDEDE